MIRGPLRRTLVIAGVAGSVVLGGATIRAAAAWTATAAPLTVAPASTETLSARLAEEEGRSAQLRRELDALRATTSDLRSALDAAQTRIAADADAADALRTRLERAKARLATLEASIARARSAGPTTPAGRPSGGGATRGDEEHEVESDG